jgi:hypothetical protein
MVLAVGVPVPRWSEHIFLEGPAVQIRYANPFLPFSSIGIAVDDNDVVPRCVWGVCAVMRPGVQLTPGMEQGKGHGTQRQIKR